ncbi:hypothetical protein NliqN6_4117 [Naganishia liquefaciens]|uniref:Spermatogenesis-associated protein 20-like TRX domain-containing protein n=1 Tax=Naganishia liquefaciens TaxID=104408 RepID=A0A8H3YFG6_9TREE|nr:hypothetical protein NliqN6_4117 [Naganishia liquefaciens]
MSTLKGKSAELPPLKNELDKAKSPYLLQHKNNPVAWQEWKPEVIERAKAEDKMIFLSVGYSACHWCHVLAHESFEDEFVAEMMNKYFINIKVDREERPDVDRVYMNYLQATSGGGGWPLSVFLTPDLTPVFAGTYFPKGRFLSLLDKINELWEEDRDRVMQSGKNVMEQLKDMQDVRSSAPAELADLVETAPHKVYAHLLKGYDKQNGGFSKRGPKFPSTSQNLVLLARYAAYNADSTNSKKKEEARQSAEMGARLLRALWEGGIRDWVGSGLARYSVDQYFRVPHFEKMLYDQGQVAQAALEFSMLPNLPDENAKKICQDLAADILEYTARDLRSPDGGFYSAEDADSGESLEHPEKHIEGGFYVWEKTEFDQVLGHEDAPIAGFFWAVKASGNVDPATDIQGELKDKNTLYQAHSYESVAQKFGISVDEVKQIIARAIPKLRAHRDKTRPRPHLDDKILTGWNGLMISALALGSVVLPSEQYPIAGRCESLASEAVAFIKANLFDEQSGKLTRSWREGKGPIGQADDYAFLIKGLLDLYEVTGQEEHLLFAVRLQATLDADFYDKEQGGYYASAPDPHILIRIRDNQDGAEPAASSVTLHNLQRLAAYASVNSERYKEYAISTYRSSADMLKRAPYAFATTVAALMDDSQGYREYIITGSSNDDFVKEARRIILASTYIPNKVVMQIDPASLPLQLAKQNPVIQSLVDDMQKKPEQRPSVRVCENGACHLPVFELEEVRTMIFGA